jgi:hypothetical protein
MLSNHTQFTTFAQPQSNCLFLFETKFIFPSQGPKTHSRLIINDVIKEDSGNYTCSAPNTLSSSIDVFVSPGKPRVQCYDIEKFSTEKRRLLAQIPQIIHKKMITTTFV